VELKMAKSYSDHSLNGHVVWSKHCKHACRREC